MSLELKLSDRTALVTGASRGIGRAVALALGRCGARVAVAAGSAAEAAEGTAASIREAGGDSTVVMGDLTDPETPERYVSACREAFGGLDIVVNNAGIWEGAAIDEMGPDFLGRVLRINLESAAGICRHAAPLLKSSPAGRIVNISSTASLLGEPRHSAYAASKGGMDALTRSLAVELGPHGITVNSVAPGWTRTEMTEADLQTDLGRKLVAEIPTRRVADPEDVAYAVCFLASDWARHINGVTLPVEGGYCIRR